MDHDEVGRQGGPAFPVSIPGCGDNGWQGMTLRDWFAGQALNGIMANSIPGSHHRPDEVVQQAFDLADMMLKARTPTSASQ